MGFAVPPPLPSGRCALTAPFHPCRPGAEGRKGGVFSVALSFALPRPGVTRHAARVEFGLSSPIARGDRVARSGRGDCTKPRRRLALAAVALVREVAHPVLDVHRRRLVARSRRRPRAEAAPEFAPARGAGARVPRPPASSRSAVTTTISPARAAREISSRIASSAAAPPRRGARGSRATCRRSARARRRRERLSPACDAAGRRAPDEGLAVVRRRRPRPAPCRSDCCRRGSRARRSGSQALVASAARAAPDAGAAAGRRARATACAHLPAVRQEEHREAGEKQRREPRTKKESIASATATTSSASERANCAKPRVAAVEVSRVVDLASARRESRPRLAAASAATGAGSRVGAGGRKRQSRPHDRARAACGQVPEPIHHRDLVTTNSARKRTSASCRTGPPQERRRRPGEVLRQEPERSRGRRGGPPRRSSRRPPRVRAR